MREREKKLNKADPQKVFGRSDFIFLSCNALFLF
jgi:hypothetical protein